MVIIKTTKNGEPANYGAIQREACEYAGLCPNIDEVWFSMLVLQLKNGKTLQDILNKKRVDQFSAMAEFLIDNQITFTFS